jgi:hypothetical protein
MIVIKWRLVSIAAGAKGRRASCSTTESSKKAAEVFAKIDAAFIFQEWMQSKLAFAKSLRDYALQVHKNKNDVTT